MIWDFITTWRLAMARYRFCSVLDFPPGALPALRNARSKTTLCPTITAPQKFERSKFSIWGSGNHCRCIAVETVISGGIARRGLRGLECPELLSTVFNGPNFGDLVAVACPLWFRQVRGRLMESVPRSSMIVGACTNIANKRSSMRMLTR